MSGSQAVAYPAGLALAAIVYFIREKSGKPAAPNLPPDIRSAGAAGEAILSTTPKQGPLVGQQLAVRGIKNLGNTCFLNAVLQSLGSFPVFREYLEALEQKAFPGPYKHTSPFTHELLKLMKDLKPEVSPATKPINPTELRKILRDKVDIFGKEDQQDAQELFQMVMRLLGEEAAMCLKNQDKTRGGLPDVGGAGGLQGLLDLSLKPDMGTVPKSLPENPLLGSLMYLRHCRGCQERSGRLERFVDLSLTLPEARYHHVMGPGSRSPQPVKLEAILEDFTQQQLVEDVECPKCAMRSAMDEAEEEEEEEGEGDEVVVPPKRVRADMRMLLATPPKTLCLHFPRRHQSPSGSEMKLKQRVVFPLQLNVAPFCYTGGCHTDNIGAGAPAKAGWNTDNIRAPTAKAFSQVKSALASGRLRPAEALLSPSTTPARSPVLAAIQSPQPHPGVKHALVGGSSVNRASAAAGGRKELNGFANGGGGSASVSGSEGRDSTEGSVSGHDGGMDYDLRAVIVHRGGADSGHYTAFRKLESNQDEMAEATAAEAAGPGRVSEAPRREGEGAGKEEWVYISDEEVERVTEKKVLSSEAYMLFYRQRITDVFPHGLT